MEGSNKKTKRNTITLTCEFNTCELSANYSKSQYIQDIVDNFPDIESIPITNCSYETLVCVVDFLEHNYVGFSMTDLIEVIKMCDFLCVSEPQMTKLFDQLYPRIKTYEKSEFTKLKPDLIKKYLFPYFKKYHSLVLLRQHNPEIHELITIELHERAKKLFPRLESFDRDILIECADYLDFIPRENISEFLLAKKKRLGFQILMNESYMEDAMLKFGSIAKLRVEKERRKRAKEKSKIKREKEAKIAKQNQAENMPILIDYVKKYGFNNYWLTNYNFQVKIQKALGVESPNYKSILDEFELYAAELIQAQKFDQLNLGTNREKFKELINKHV